ncbi:MULTISPECIES: UDP-3-O-(3-hydroxymyristoyl)glucosamine N-acyltransferase [unclassified Wenzhouxiangella]|uniref:UDP-3-O-(3-hydroxymyristoyl)glucosamine N-acyltransferase n=1 Tax=unclassified Wenzhouxiangella TaxID=2613841 RepID=UPI000E326DC0|nr:MULTISPECIES: UDP-3-O-(3-hydroxymyristoyl)glucosamine N-acyltransferase [unclassified Wenzhouxiangella]RFF27099.1 UDP-3-O-(3-hydroxymyristoyl)glucosamine N-acyltransferase [Wenzhouxiangella sp. 15181]RFP69215.1 UDP-3-O-(3-hydroxymyristoyl)glucosamine N-acyltransferase [Wenzhouxiangella sp. 15190]
MQDTTLKALADRFGLTLRGDPDHRVGSLATLATAGPQDVSFLANPSYATQLAECRAGAVIIGEALAERWDGNALISSNPYATWAKVAAWLSPRASTEPGKHPTAVVGERASIDPSASIGPHVSIGTRAHIGANVVIGPGCVVDDDVSIGDDSRLLARVYVGPGCQLGQRVLVHPGVVIGADGFGLAMDAGHWIKVPQLGAVVIGDDCEIGANTTIDRGAIEDTELAEDVRLDNQVQIAHNVRIGAHTAIAGCVGVAGSTHIGRYCMIAGACGIGGHLSICDKVVITAMSTVLDSITEPGEYGSGIPARPHARWKRILVRLGQLDDWVRRLRRLERNQS